MEQKELLKLTAEDVVVPANVDPRYAHIYVDNYLSVTRGSGRLMLQAADQKIEHLNKDFYDGGKKISLDDADPEHLFRIASKGDIGVFAGQLGLISKYGPSYPDVSYVVKMNSKTSVVKTEQMDPRSAILSSVDQVLELAQYGGLDIVGVGMTVYAGSEYEDVMLSEVAHMISEAHRVGLLTIVWSYPRGKAIEEETDPHLIAGAAGLACALGSDFVKVNLPKLDGKGAPESLKEASTAAGRTHLITAGGSSLPPADFLKQTWETIHSGGAWGSATGRNIHQKDLDEAVRLTRAISAIVYENKSVEDAVKIYEGK